MKQFDVIKLFQISNMMAERQLDKIEEDFHLDFNRDILKKDDKDEEYYPQFLESIRREATDMAEHYELFYCLEESIRDLVESKLKSEHGLDWWKQCVPPPVKDTYTKNVQKEKDAGVTQRSTREINYINFGELGEIVRSNWQSFSDTFNSEKAFSKIMSSLNTLRVPIAHCSPLAQDEVMRLRLTVKDWFRLME